MTIKLQSKIIKKETSTPEETKKIATLTIAGTEYDVDKIVLFGSRARGDWRERSDIDIAVYGGNADSFALDTDEDVPTLLKFDIVNMNGEVQVELIDSINNEGVVIYEKI